jgi:hypothetical protein
MIWTIQFGHETNCSTTEVIAILLIQTQTLRCWEKVIHKTCDDTGDE